MVTLKNGNSVLKINEKGAEMKSFTVNDVEYLWVGNPDIWAPSAPNIFPMTGGFKDDRYILDGKEYNMPKHGFAKNMEFTVEECTDTTAVFLLTATEETKVYWPFEFELRICYELFDGKVSVDYKVSNINDKTMWFSIGSHDGFATPEGIEEYDIFFAEKETLNASNVHGNLIGDDTTPIIADTDTLALKYAYFAIDALVFKSTNSKSCKLVNRNTGRGIQLDFPNFPVLMIWTKSNAPYICIEPWFGAPDHVDSNYDITKKFAIQSIEPGKTFVCNRVITAL